MGRTLRISRISLVLLSFSCAPGQQVYPDCVSSQGARVYDYAGTCEDFQAAEDRILTILPIRLQEAGWSAMTSSDLEFALRNYPVYVDPDILARGLSGQTHCGQSIDLAYEDWHFNAFAHEAAHIALGCWDPHHFNHENWWNGIYQAIKEAKLQHE